MKKFSYNENIDALEVSELFFTEGLKQAEKKGYKNIRVMKDSSAPASAALDLSALSEGSLIESINISQDINVKKVDFTPLYRCNQLKELRLPYFKGVVDFPKIKNLQTLYITATKDEVENLILNDVNDLLLTGIKNKDLTFLSAPKLEVLRLSGGSIESLNGLQTSEKLSTIGISHCSKLSDIKVLSKLKTLDSISVEKCKELRDYSFLSGNATLKKLFASELSSLAFLPSLKKIEFVKFWEVEDGDLDPLLNTETLRTVDFYPNRKHYTHTNEHIDELLLERHKRN